jgi:acylphosphatase
MKKSARFVVLGTVQGVFFRNFVVEHANTCGLRGFVRNLESGDVEIIVEGEKDSIEKFAEKIKKGPQHSQIRDLKVEERKWSGEFKDFKVLRF